MNYKNILYLLMAACSLGITPLQAVIINITLWQLETEKGSIKVLLLSDAHLSSVHDKIQKKSFFSSLNRLKKHDKQTTLLVEAPEKNWFQRPECKSHEAFMKKIEENDTMKFMFSVGSFVSFDNKFGSIICQPGDIRSKNISFLPYISEQIMKEIPVEQIENNPVIKNNSYTIEDFISELKNTSSHSKVLMQCSNDDAVRASLERVRIKLDQKIEVAANFFSTNTQCKNKLVSDVFINYFKQNRQQKVVEFVRSNWLHPAHDSCADIGFLEKFLAAKEKGSDVIFVAGAAHTAVFFELLKDFESQGKASCIYQAGKCFSVEEAEEFHLQDDFQELSAFNLIFGLQIFEQSCFSCHKSQPGKSCGACKLAKYCSVGCQKKDWHTHKLVCKKK